MQAAARLQAAWTLSAFTPRAGQAVLEGTGRQLGAGGIPERVRVEIWAERRPWLELLDELPAATRALVPLKGRVPAERSQV